MPVDHSDAIEVMGGELSKALRASWLPKITNGWFFRAESFFSVARYLDEAARGSPGAAPPDFLSHSHGEGFLRFFEERCQRQGIFIFDEPESALSPSRQIEFLKLMRRMEQSGDLPGHHGHAFADADGLSRRAAAAADEIRAGAGDRRSRPITTRSCGSSATIRRGSWRRRSGSRGGDGAACCAVSSSIPTTWRQRPGVQSTGRN